MPTGRTEAVFSHRFAAHQKAPAQIHAHDPLEFLQCHSHQRALDDDAGAVDHDVRHLAGGIERRKGGQDLRLRRDVGGRREAPARHRICLPVDARDPGALGRQLPNRGGTDTAGGSGYHRERTCERLAGVCGALRNCVENTSGAPSGCDARTDHPILTCSRTDARWPASVRSRYLLNRARIVSNGESDPLGALRLRLVRASTVVAGLSSSLTCSLRAARAGATSGSPDTSSFHCRCR